MMTERQELTKNTTALLLLMISNLAPGHIDLLYYIFSSLHLDMTAGLSRTRSHRSFGGY
jgi:hypothetical protein